MMGKLIRFVTYLIGLLVILVIAAVLLVPRFFDPNDFKPQLVSLVKEKAGRDIIIDGDIKLSVFPWIGVSLGKVELMELPVFGNQQLLAVDSADVKVKLLPLLSKTVELDRVSLDGLRLNLVRLPNGIANWETLTVPDSTEASPQASVETDQETGQSGDDGSKEAGSGLGALTLAGLSLKNAAISFDDRLASQKVIVEQLNLNVDKVGFDQPIPFDANFIAQVSQPQLKDRMNISGRLTLNEAIDQFTIDNLKLNTDLEGSIVQEGLVQFDLSSQEIRFDKQTMSVQLPSGVNLKINGKGGQLPAVFNVNLKTPKLSINNVFSQFEIGALDLVGQLTGDAVKQGTVDFSLNSSEIEFNKNTLSANLPTGLKLDIHGGGGELPEKFNASLQLPAIRISSQDKFDLGQLNFSAHAEGQDFPGGKVDAQLTTKVSGDLARQIVSLADIQLLVSDLVVNGQLSGTSIIDAPEFTGQIVVKEVNAKKLAEDFGVVLPEMQDPSALTQFAFSSDVFVSKQAAKLNNLTISLDDSQLKGKAALNDIETQAIAFNLKLDMINVDRYMPPKAKQAKTTETTDNLSLETEVPAKSSSQPGLNSTTSVAEIIPIEAIRKLNMSGKLVIDELLINGLKAKKVQFSVTGKDGLVEAKPSIGTFYEGKINAGLVVNAKQDKPIVTINNTVSNIAIEPLLKQLTGETYISGSANMSTNLTAQGATEKAILASLNGLVKANFLDGAIYGVNIPKMIRDGVSRLQGQAVDEESVAKTDFSELNMLSKIRNGVVTTENLELKSPLIRILGNGTLNLNTRELKYRTSVKLVDSLKGQGGDSPTDLTGIPIPLLITGTLDNIRYELDTKAAVQEALKTKVGKQAEEKAQALIDKNKTKVMDKINKKLGDKLGSDLEKGAGELLKGLF